MGAPGVRVVGGFFFWGGGDLSIFSTTVGDRSQMRAQSRGGNTKCHMPIQTSLG